MHAAAAGSQAAAATSGSRGRRWSSPAEGLGGAGGVKGRASEGGRSTHLEHVQRRVDEVHLDVERGGTVRRNAHRVEQRTAQVHQVAVELLAQVALRSGGQPGAGARPSINLAGSAAPAATAAAGPAPCAWSCRCRRALAAPHAESGPPTSLVLLLAAHLHGSVRGHQVRPSRARHRAAWGQAAAAATALQEVANAGVPGRNLQ